MRRLFATAAALCLIVPAAFAAEERLGEVSTVHNWLTPDHKIVIEAFDDPDVPGVACHLSRPETGGLAGAVGLAEDKSDSSLACRQIGPITVDLKALKRKDGDKVFKKSTNVWFKKMQVVRFVDLKRNTIVYLSYSDRLIDGSPKNAISSVPVMPWRD